MIRFRYLHTWNSQDESGHVLLIFQPTYPFVKFTHSREPDIITRLLGARSSSDHDFVIERYDVEKAKKGFGCCLPPPIWCYSFRRI